MPTQTQRDQDLFIKALSCAHEPIPLIDAAPDMRYPLRILKAHRESCNYRWGAGNDWKESETERFKELNYICDERAKILDVAIAILEREMV